MKDFEEVRDNLQMIAEMLNRMPLEHSRDIFAQTAEQMDGFLANVTPDMNGEQVAKKGQTILQSCYQKLSQLKSLTPEQKQLQEYIEELNKR